MELILNDFSLDGQFKGVEDFAECRAHLSIIVCTV